MVEDGTTCAVVEEQIDLDYAGLLVRGRVTVADALAPRFDRVAGAVEVARGDVRTRFDLPSAQAWAYASPETPATGPIATPLAAWVTHRAAQAGPWVRVVGADAAKSFV